MKIYKTFSSRETKKLGESIARDLVLSKPKGLSHSNPERGATVVALVGDLGSGKTTFAQGFLRGLGVRGKITSPTFVILKRYALRALRFAHVHHADLYRLNAKQLAPLGFKELLKDPRSIVLVEWADRTKKIFPKDTVWIRFEHGEKESKRIIKIV